MSDPSRSRGPEPGNGLSTNGKGDGEAAHRLIGGRPVADDVFTPETITKRALAETFEAAMFDVAVDDDGDLSVRDTYKIWVSLPSPDRIRFVCIFGFREESAPDLRLALVNRINNDLVVIRACESHDRLFIDWYLPVRGGLPRKTVVQALRTFSKLIDGIGACDEDDIIA